MEVVGLDLLSPPHSKTLRARGVCSRIPHLRLFRRAHHGLLIAHVYAHIIPYLVISRLPPAGADRASSSMLVVIILPINIAQNRPTKLPLK